jgi:hypothetical protein
MVAAIDVAFIDRENLGSVAKPAGIASSVTPISSTGSTLAAIDSDLARIIQALRTRDQNSKPRCG